MRRTQVLPVVWYGIFIFMLLTGSLFSQGTVLRPDIKNDLNFQYYESEYAPGKYLLPDDPALSFVPYANKKLPLTKQRDIRMFTFRTSFCTAETPQADPWFLVLPPFEYPANVYLNGTLIYMRGDITRGYSNRLFETKSVLLPPGLMNKAQKVNTLAIQVYALDGETQRPFGKISITNRETAVHEEYIRNLLGTHFAFVLLIVSIFIAVYFIHLHLSNMGEGSKYFLYLSMSNLAAGFSLINNALTYDFQNVFFLEIISKIGYSCAALLSALFVIEYSGVLKGTVKKWIMRSMSVLFTAGIFLFASQKTSTEVLRWYTPQIFLFMYPALLLVIYLLFRSMRAKTRLFAGWLALVYACNVMFISHDTYYYLVLQTKPYIPLVPYGMMFVNLMVFFILAYEQGLLLKRTVKSEEELKRLYGSLEHLVNERTAQLDQANKTKDKIAFIIGHDLKNIFNTLINYSESMIEDVRQGQFKNINDDSKLVLNASRKAFLFLENLLEWSAVQAKLASCSPEKCELAPLILESIEPIQFQSIKKHINFELFIPPGYYINADKRMLQSVVRNLASNAIKYSFPEGTVKISAAEKGGKVMIAVTDHGTGIELVQNLYKPEVQESVQGTLQERGSGIGLLLTKELLAVHDSTLEISSRPGKGSTFSFSIQKWENE